MKYRLSLTDENGKEVAFRILGFDFGGIGKDSPGKWSSHEEYQTALKAREMYRDAAFSAGKWPTRDELLARAADN
jgi:hypothetical protein